VHTKIKINGKHGRRRGREGKGGERREEGGKREGFISFFYIKISKFEKKNLKNEGAREGKYTGWIKSGARRADCEGARNFTCARRSVGPTRSADGTHRVVQARVFYDLSLQI
jgi:hypothetical protein